MLLKKSVHAQLLQFIKGKTDYEIYKELVGLALNKSSTIGTILAKAPLIS